ncbi:MAG TPA: hypothetical protein PKE63_05860 [Lacibacter sp.]|nr:hypothetical protein [Lacibacter sp.]HMO88127.1 hypothetical protein [Lacibacter sp.]HMP86783.1 hypothetical protein [Lacibacter sp.]
MHLYSLSSRHHFRPALLLFAFIALLSSCSMHEEIDLSVNGNGSYESRIDMSPMLELMAGISNQPDSIMNEVRDTILPLHAMAAGMENDLTPQELAYLSNTVLRMQVDMKEKKMEIRVKSPVKNAADLRDYFRALQRLDSLMAVKKREEPQQDASGQMPNLLSSLGGSMPGGNALPFKPSPYVVTDTSIERLTVSADELMNEMGDQAQGAAMFFSQVNYTTTIKLPRVVKRVEGKNLKLGGDKRSLFFSASLQDLVDNPAAGAFKVVF